MENDSTKNVGPLLKRTYMFLEDKDFEKAIEYCERILDIDPENAEAYLGKLMAEMKVCRLEDLQNLPELFNNSSDFQKVMRFADNDLKNKLNGYLQQITERKEYERKEALFNSACEEQCKDTISSLEKAIEIFSSIIEWNNAKIRIAACKNRIAEINAEKEERRKKAEKQAELDKIAAEESANKAKKIAITIATIISVIIVITIILITVVIPNSKYNNAVSMISKGNYGEAIEILKDIENHKDSAKLLNETMISYAAEFEKNNDSANAIKWYEEAGNNDKANAVRYAYIISHKDRTDEITYKYLLKLKDINYKDTASLYKEIYKLTAKIWINKDRNDMTTNYTTLPQYNQSEGYVDAYCHYTVTGGPPGEKISIRILYETRLKPGLGNNPIQEYREDEDKTFEVTSGEHQTFFYFNMASNLIYHRVTIYDQNTGEQLAQTSIYTPWNR